MTGGQYDVDVSLEGPRGEVIYRQIKTQFDSHQFTASVSQKKKTHTNICSQHSSISIYDVCIVIFLMYTRRQKCQLDLFLTYSNSYFDFAGDRRL